mmetsp:Transcript_6414/g.9341  ORF Transcript_6414/g.9341 Transcript_6414/m.9341 type:complete len:618 (-) Transcript_6414:212-2065(-)
MPTCFLKSVVAFVHSNNKGNKNHKSRSGSIHSGIIVCSPSNINTFHQEQEPNVNLKTRNNTSKRRSCCYWMILASTAAAVTSAITIRSLSTNKAGAATLNPFLLLASSASSFSTSFVSVRNTQHKKSKHRWNKRFCIDSDCSLTRRQYGSSRSRLFCSTLLTFSMNNSNSTSSGVGVSDNVRIMTEEKKDGEEGEERIKMEQERARRVSASDSSLASCGERLRNGDLVAFPTETVYGLGCHALDENAVLKVFEAKHRPLTDPLIIHVVDTQDALPLWATSTTSSSSSSVLKILADAFWPGPLTLVAEANTDKVPSVIMANTGYVAIRSPSHEIARKLITLAGVPIAAPSANRFGHVSPTNPNHVLNDLGLENVWVVDPLHPMENDAPPPNPSSQQQHESQVLCQVGVESTVAKVDEQSRTVSILRHGAVSPRDMERCLRDAGIHDYSVDVRARTTSDQVKNVAPGQTVRHYAPDVVSFLISHNRWNKQRQRDSAAADQLTPEEQDVVGKAVVMDFGKRLAFLKDKCLAYRDLSPKGDSSEAASRVFQYLRWAEGVHMAERVYFPEIIVHGEQHDQDGLGDNHDAAAAAGDASPDGLMMAIKDRLTRAASGVVIDEFR